MSDTDDDRLVTAIEARDLAGIPNARVRTWSFYKRVQIRGTRGRFNIYRLGDLRALNRQAASHPLATR